jgi:hypothetical protein
MKPAIALVVLLGALAARGADTQPAIAPATPPVQPAALQDQPQQPQAGAVSAASTEVAPPVVRVPPIAHPPSQMVLDEAELPAIGAPLDEPAMTGAPAFAGELGWSTNLAARQTVVSTVGTNELRNRPVLPKLVRPERRGFGGFMASFANLFNPLAPTEQGVAAGREPWYDAQINTGPLPRSMRDERFHEPQAGLVMIGLDGQVSGPR